MSDLLALTTTLIEFLTPTGDEGPVADWLADRYAARGDVVMRVGNSIIAAPPEDEGDDRPVVALVGHTDVVAPTDDDRVARIDGENLVGRGASDMLSGLAVLMTCFEDEAVRNGPYRVTLIAYGGEEGPNETNELRNVFAAVPGIADSALAIIGEPTNLNAELGCQGSMHALVTFEGKQAHSSRPWQGSNALTAAGEWLASMHDRAAEDVTVDGLVYREVISPTQVWSENNRNVIPGALTVNVNYRFAPNRTLDEAETVLRAVIGPVGSIEIVDRSPACPPKRDAELVTRFLTETGVAVEPKQAWTDVARFAEIGVPALNYGPGLTAQAHQRGEYVPVSNLNAALETLTRFLAG